MRDELEEAVAGLDPGEVSKPVRAEQQHPHRPPRRAHRRRHRDDQCPDSAREEIKEKLYAQALEERYARWLKEDLRQKHSVEMLP